VVAAGIQVTHVLSAADVYFHVCVGARCLPCENVVLNCGRPAVVPVCPLYSVVGLSDSAGRNYASAFRHRM